MRFKNLLFLLGFLATTAWADIGGNQAWMPTTPISTGLADAGLTSTTDAPGRFASVAVTATWSSNITGSPSGCTLQPQWSLDGSNWANFGNAWNLSPASSTTQNLGAPPQHPNDLTNNFRYVYACSTYPTSGTLTVRALYQATDQAPSGAFGTIGRPIPVGAMIMGVSDSSSNTQAAVGGVAEPTALTGILNVLASSELTTPFSATSATGTVTSSADNTGPFAGFVAEMVYSGITGSPSGCGLDVQVSQDASHFLSLGCTLSLSPGGTNQMLLWPYSCNVNTPNGFSLGRQVKYVYTCSAYPSGGTMTMSTHYFSGSAAPGNTGVLSANPTYINVADISGNAVSTVASGVQKVGIVGFTGTSFESTAGIMDTNVKNVGGNAASTAATGVLKVGVVGSTGTSFESSAGVLDANIKNVGGSAVASSSGSLKVIAWDGTTATTVKAASTAAAVADTSLVVQLNPNPANLVCNLTAKFQITSADLKVVSGVSSKKIYVCAIFGGTATNVTSTTYNFREGTGTTCGTNTVDDLVYWQSGTSAGVTNINMATQYPIFATSVAANDLCIHESGTTGSNTGFIAYAQQ